MPISHSRHPYYSYKSRRHTPEKRRYPKWLLIIMCFFVVSGCIYWYIQPLSPIASKDKVLSVRVPSKATITWPATSQAAVGTIDQGVLEKKPNQSPKPTASTAKIITALTVLKHKPMTTGETGPEITMSQKDVDLYNQYYANDGSVAKIVVGQKLTQYQMLQGLLLPSANNYADSLAIWAFGSLQSYQKAAQTLVGELDMQQTTVGSDASGFAPDTLSTAEDLTKLAIAAMRQPVIAEIIAQDQVDLPVAGVKQNTNWLLGADGVIGIKTGNTNEAGGVYVFASQYMVDSTHSTIIVGAVQGEPTIVSAMNQARSLISQAKTHLTLETIVKKDQVVATYTTPWRKQVDAVAGSDLQVLVWQATTIKPTVVVREVTAPTQKGTIVGKIKVGNSFSEVVLEGTLDVPPWQWRVLRW